MQRELHFKLPLGVTLSQNVWWPVDRPKKYA